MLTRLMLVMLLACAGAWGQSYDPIELHIEDNDFESSWYFFPNESVIPETDEEPLYGWDYYLPETTIPDTKPGEGNVPETGSITGYGTTAWVSSSGITAATLNYPTPDNIVIMDEYLCPDFKLEIFVQFEGHKYQTPTLVAAGVLIRALKAAGKTVHLELGFAGCN